MADPGTHGLHLWAEILERPVLSGRIIVTGSRHWTDAAAVEREFTTLASLYGDPARVIVVHGDGRGLDRIAAAAAARLGMTTEAHPADWARFGRAAGPIRSQEMASLGADLCLAFPLGASRGTQDCVDACRKAGIPVCVIGDETDGGPR